MIHIVVILTFAAVCIVWGMTTGYRCSCDPSRRTCDASLSACPRRDAGRASGLAVFMVCMVLGAGFGWRMLDSSRLPPSSGEVTAGRTIMGTLWRITVRPGEGESRETARAAMAQAFAEVERVDDLMSTWRDDTPISAVNAGAGGAPVAAPIELCAIVERGLEWGARSGGAFDVTFAGFGRLWRLGDDDFAPPAPDAIAAARARVDYRRVSVSDGHIGLAGADMAIGLGGIAKGYGVDRAALALEAAGFDYYLVDGGGDVRVSTPPGEPPWRVGVRDPRGRAGVLLCELEVESGAVATSGDYERFRIHEGVRYHHIIDPRTGLPASATQAVTVTAPDAETADALATAVFVLGSDRGLELIEETPGASGFIIDAAGRQSGVPHATTR